MTDKYLGGCKWEQYVLISQLAQLFYLFCLQQSEYGSSKIDFHRKVFAFKGNLFIAFIVKNINRGIKVEEVSQLYKLCNSVFTVSFSVFKSL